jgi:hypothetical protein
MKRVNKFLLGVAVLAIAALACSAVGGGGGGGGIPTSNPISPTDVPLELPTVSVPPAATEGESQANAGDVLFEDDFVPGRREWGTGSDADRTVEYVDETLSIKIATENYFVWTTPNDKDYSNIHLEVTAYNHSTDSNAGFGIICNQQFIEDSTYYFVITPAGEYAIVLAALAQDDKFLTNNGEWASSDLIAKNAESYRIGADCGNGKLTLYVDGQMIDSVNDSTYTSGGFALFGLSAKEANATEVAFDDFVITQLP